MIELKRNLDTFWTYTPSEKEEQKTGFKCKILSGIDYHRAMESMTFIDTSRFRFDPVSMVEILKKSIVDWQNVKVDSKEEFAPDMIEHLPLDIKIFLIKEIVSKSTLSEEEKKT